MPTGLRAMPALSCTNVEASANDLIHGFGFEAAGFLRDDDGAANFAILRLDAITLALHRADAVHADRTWSAYLYVDDAEALAELADAQGMAVEGPTEQPWRCLEVIFTDRDGNRVVFSQDLAPGPNGPGL